MHLKTDHFSAACDQAGMKINTNKTELLCLSRDPRQCMLQVSGNTLQQVEMFKYVAVAITSNGRRNKEIDANC